MYYCGYISQKIDEGFLTFTRSKLAQVIFLYHDTISKAGLIDSLPHVRRKLTSCFHSDVYVSYTSVQRK